MYLKIRSDHIHEIDTVLCGIIIILQIDMIKLKILNI